MHSKADRYPTIFHHPKYNDQIVNIYKTILCRYDVDTIDRPLINSDKIPKFYDNSQF